MKRRRFVLLDRDGTIIAERHYLSDPSQIEFIPGVIEGLRQLSQMGLGLVVITNQSGVGRGFFDETRLAFIHRRLCEVLETEQVRLDGIYYCPHVPEGECSCRKPRPGLVKQAARQLNFDLQDAFVIGDKSCDVELGQRVGATTFLVRTGYGTQVAAEALSNPDYIVDDMREAAHVIAQLLASNHGRTTNATKP
jgi:D-glycero-D-manno-heptose 1,7-bisphosphate phosphatase